MADTREFPEIEFVTKTAGEILTELIETWEVAMGRKLGMGDPIRAMLAWEASVDAQLYAAINETGKLNMPRYAYGEYLDSLAENYYHGLTRMEATTAKTTIRFTLSQEAEYDIAVPAGTRITHNGEVLFETTETRYVKAGDMYIDVEAACTQEGTIGNGYQAGTINACVDKDNVEKLASVVNLTESEGGATRESDEDFYVRMRGSVAAYSTAGPAGSYEYHAKSANANVGDVRVMSPSPGEVNVYILGTNGQSPGEELIKEVENYLGQDNIRPMTDHVTVKAPEGKTFNIDITWYRDIDDDGREKMEAAVEKAVSTYVEWQTTRIGRDINPSYLIKTLMDTGIKRVTVKEPEFTVVGEYQVASLGTLKTSYGGEEDE